MTNKLVNQKTYFPEHHVFNEAGVFVGRIEKDQYGAWYVSDSKGNRFPAWSYREARAEAQFLKAK